MQALQYLLALRVPSLEHKDTPLPPLRPFTPLLLPLLSDPDQHVRSLALSTTIVVFSAPSVTPAAKGDLKKEMIKLDVNKKVQEAVLAAVLGGGPASSSTAASAATSPGPQADTVSVSDDGQQEPPRARRRPPSPETLAANLPASAFPSDPSAVHTPAVSAADIPPVYIATARDLHAEFQPMKAGFEGRETEHNWVMRDRSVTRLRGMVKADVKGRCGDEFLTELKGVVEGVLKTVSARRDWSDLLVDALTARVTDERHRPCAQPWPSQPCPSSPNSRSHSNQHSTLTTSTSSSCRTASSWPGRPRRSSPPLLNQPLRRCSATTQHTTTIAHLICLLSV